MVKYTNYTPALGLYNAVPSDLNVLASGLTFSLLKYSLNSHFHNEIYPDPAA